MTKRAPSPEMLRRLLLGDLRRIFRDRWGYQFPDDDAGRGDLEVLLRVIGLHPTHGRERMKNAIEIYASWMSEEEAELLVHDFATLDPRRQRLSQEELREKVWLSTADWERLKAWRVLPCDKTPAELAEYRKARKNERRRVRRGKTPRAAIVSAKRKPWERDGVSRATWYRRRARGTGVVPQLKSPVSSCARKHQTNGEHP